MPAIDLTGGAATTLLTKRYYGSGYGNYYNNGTSHWHKFRWLFFLLILIPILGLILFWWGCKFLQRSNRRRQAEGTAPTQEWDPNQPQAQGGNGDYYTANQQQQQQGYNKEAAGVGDQHSSNFSAPTYGDGTNNTYATQGHNVEYPDQTYQRPTGPPPNTTGAANF